eukprot:m.981285 g.981285  ORF g.981285 m.981285 type:complete len:162 (+) comp23972_c0_seq9:2825-3310(+)
MKEKMYIDIAICLRPWFMARFKYLQAKHNLWSADTSTCVFSPSGGTPGALREAAHRRKAAFDKCRTNVFQHRTMIHRGEYNHQNYTFLQVSKSGSSSVRTLVYTTLNGSTLKSYVKDDSKYFAFVRDPTDRFISGFNECVYSRIAFVSVIVACLQWLCTYT